MRRFIETGAARIAKSPDDLLVAINAYLANPTRDREGRARGRVRRCDRLDGESGRRIGEFVRSKLPGTASRVAPGPPELAAAARR